jgi:AcrR family transcriptional regulator
MTVMATRKYEQRLRADAAAETRCRILDAVYQWLREAPSEPASIDRIARMARVARPTVYQVFGSRAGLFEAVGADLLERGGFGRMLQAAAHPDAREALRGGIRGVVEMYAAHRDVLRVLSSMALLDAADLLWLLTSFDSFDLLYTGRDLSSEETATTLITTAERSLCR